MFERTVSFFREIWLRRHQVYRKFMYERSLKEKIIIVIQLINNLNLLFKRKFGWCLPLSLGPPGDELRDPLRLLNIRMVEEALIPLNIKVDNNIEKRFNFILPGIEPSFIYGGYIAVFHFMKRLIEEGCKVRIILQQRTTSKADIIRQLDPDSPIKYCIQECDLFDAHDREVELHVSNEDIFIGYSWPTSRLAQMAAAETNGKPFVFFIQDYEPIFYEYDSIRAICDETYSLNHIAVFNSPDLANFFRDKKLGVFENCTNGNGKWLAFQHAIADVRTPSVKELKVRTQRQMLLYARPEKHAGRNLFELLILALRRAVDTGQLDNSWKFVGIGGQDAGADISLGNGLNVSMLQRMKFNEYCEKLSNFDVGISLMYSPHPSVPPLEMAAAGMVVVTTSFENRSPERMSEISKNLIAVKPGINSVSQGIIEAVKRVDDYDARIMNAKFEWSRSWEQSFNKDFISSFVTICYRH